MALGGIAELFFGVKAEQAELEDIAKPLTAEEARGGRARRMRRATRTGHPRRSSTARAPPRSARGAAEHRAAVHELRPRAEDGDRRAADRTGAEEALAAHRRPAVGREDERASAREAARR